MGYVLQFERRDNAEQVPAARLASETSPLTVHISTRSGAKLPSWNPRDNAAVLILLRE
jgi:hypothetical protein